MAKREKGFIYEFCVSVASLILRVFFHFRIYGREKIPSGPVLLVSNHASYVDPLLIGAVVRNRHLRFLARQTLMNSFLARWFFKKVRIIPLDRDKGADIRAFRKILALLEEGESVALFPEGTRSRGGDLLPAKKGVGFIAFQAKVPIVPIRLFNTHQIWPQGARLPRLWRRPRITAVVGDSLSPEEINSDGWAKDYQKIADRIMQAIHEVNRTVS